LQYLAEERHPDAEKIIAAMDNLNTHSPASLYAAFEPEAAPRIAQRFEIHYAPKHGSWLNMAELETGVVSRQCLGRRLPTIEKMTNEVQAWVSERNNHKAAVRWQFTTADARIKLRHLYPSF
jgi:transposase